MEINKWYHNSKNEILELIFILNVTDKYYKVLSIQNGIRSITEYPCFIVDENYIECEYIEIKDNRYTVFDVLYNYLGEINL